MHWCAAGRGAARIPAKHLRGRDSPPARSATEREPPLVIVVIMDPQLTLQLIETRLPEGPVAFEPTDDALQRHRVDPVNAFASDSFIRHRKRVPQRRAIAR